MDNEEFSGSIFSTGEVADMLGIRMDKLQNALYHGKLQLPNMKLGGRIVWESKDIDRAREYFKKGE